MTLQEIRKQFGCSFSEARLVIQYCDNIELAAVWLKYYGCAINVKPKHNETKEQAYLRWVMSKAKEYMELEICEICGQKAAKKIVTDYTFQWLSHKVELKDIERYKCGSCGEEYFNHDQEQVLRTAGFAALDRPRDLYKW